MALVKCPECGKEISDTTIMCPHCGYQYHFNVVDKKYREKERLGAIMICVPLGFTGLHWLYLDDVYMFILYFFTFGLFGFGWIHDIFVLIFRIKGKYFDPEEQPLYPRKAIKKR